MTVNRELRASAAAAAVLGAFIAGIIATPEVKFSDFMFLFSEVILGASTLWLFVGFAAAVMLLAKGARMGAEAPRPHHLLQSWVMERWQRDRMISLFWPPILFAALMASYNCYKQRILVEYGFVYDSLFEAMDRALFLGHDPWVVTHSLLGSPAATSFVGHLYHGWYAPMSIGVILCAWLPAVTWRTRTRYMFCYLGIWIVLGCGIATLLPAAGPIFVPMMIEPNASFTALTQRLTETDHLYHLAALDFQEMLAAAHHSDGVRLAGGISAMPSVHNALAVLFAIVAFSVSRQIGWLMAIYAFMIWVGSIHLGWHYAIDGLASLVVTLGLWRISTPVADWLEGTRQLFPAERLAAVA